MTVALFAGAVFLLPLSLSAQEEEPSPYAGTDTCQVCHEDIFESFQDDPHAVLDKERRRGWAEKACESCHGPGAEHSDSMEAADILNPLNLTPMEADRNCLQCHLNEPTQVGRIRGGHARNQVSCLSCHPVHSRETATKQPRRSVRINQQCSECHPAASASFQRPYAHKLTQGAIACVDCHNPHGNFLPGNLQTVSASEPGCFRCHGDKRGPFVYEHAPVRLEGCTSCHESHGSANPRMLTRHEVSNLCLECHSNIVTPSGTTRTGALGGIAPGFHDMRSARFRNCTICHVKIHGSQVDRDFLR